MPHKPRRTCGAGGARRQGLRPIQIWVPDVRSPTFVAAAHEQSLAVAKSADARADQSFIDAVSWIDDEDD
ncbi:MAG: antitoxin MazE family protein [Mycobacterium sp.]